MEVVVQLCAVIETPISMHIDWVGLLYVNRNSKLIYKKEKGTLEPEELTSNPDEHFTSLVILSKSHMFLSLCFFIC